MSSLSFTFLYTHDIVELVAKAYTLINVPPLWLDKCLLTVLIRLDEYVRYGDRKNSTVDVRALVNFRGKNE